MKKALLVFCLFYSGILSQTYMTSPNPPTVAAKQIIKYKAIDSSLKSDFKHVILKKSEISFSYTVGENALKFYDGCNRCQIISGEFHQIRCTRYRCRRPYSISWMAIQKVRRQMNGILKNMKPAAFKEFLKKDHGKIFTLQDKADKSSWVKLEKMEK